MDYLKILYYGLFSTSLVALLLNWRNLQRRHMVFVPLLAIGIINQLLIDFLHYKGIDGNFLFHIYVPIEFALLSVYYNFLFSNKKIRNLIFLSNVILLIYCTVTYYITDAFWEKDFRHFLLLSVFVTSMVVGFFISLYKNEEDIPLMKYPDFWINAGNLLFYACCIFVMGLYHKIKQQDEKLADKLLHINYYANLILYLFYIIAFTCQIRKKKSSRLLLQEQP
jgi:hypothetical protein